MTDDDDYLVAMGLQSCWVRPALAEALEDAGLVEYSLTQDPESGAIADGLALTDGTTPDDVWDWLRDNGEDGA